MKTTSAVAFALFGAALSAPSLRERQVPTVTLSLINDQSGANAPATVNADGTVYTIPSLFSGSRVDNAGNILASSAQLVKFPTDVYCSFNAPGKTVNINSRQTWVDLDLTPGAVPVNLNGFTFTCKTA
ncbi:hypothetical protein BU24DRAFT_427266 [Aaosphaeria arxii CBS 175.79]|uniref:Uncharacterized protein n=1 Tax=Aaosphaeria arxii CBS 175.79 TaxID=1450172 RepID=A0A6A5XE19_9PLEO|nr:uncharacterized protein BU24DRAFT_427266 [Aaosphaeria arxii CBS 175.79]KAF2011057.1 hypothetical protein BU24DRAFT_427266 [Aaosphaeria arxii CBS 175.79]